MLNDELDDFSPSWLMRAFGETGVNDLVFRGQRVREEEFPATVEMVRMGEAGADPRTFGGGDGGVKGLHCSQPRLAPRDSFR